jgi:hypothetical protein
MPPSTCTPAKTVRVKYYEVVLPFSQWRRRPKWLAQDSFNFQEWRRIMRSYNMRRSVTRSLVTVLLLNYLANAIYLGCSKGSVFVTRSFGCTKYGVGRPRSFTPLMLEALCEHLLEKAGLYRYAMALSLFDTFKTCVMPRSIERALASICWAKKTVRRIAKGQNAEGSCFVGIRLVAHFACPLKSYLIATKIAKLHCIANYGARELAAHPS